MKRFTIIIVLWLTIVNLVQSYNYNYIRALPFIQMMIVMMDFMDKFMGGNKNYYPGMNYGGNSPYTSMPGSGFGNFSGFPMSPAWNNMSPLNSNSFLADGFNAINSSENSSIANKDSSGKAINDKETSPAGSNNLNGIWQALSGDVIAIYNNNRFLWSDGLKRHLAGRIIIRGKQFFAYIPAKQTTLTFEFYMEPGQFVVRDKQGRIYAFKRIY